MHRDWKDEGYPESSGKGFEWSTVENNPYKQDAYHGQYGEEALYSTPYEEEDLCGQEDIGQTHQAQGAESENGYSQGKEDGFFYGQEGYQDGEDQQEDPFDEDWMAEERYKKAPGRLSLRRGVAIGILVLCVLAASVVGSLSGIYYMQNKYGLSGTTGDSGTSAGLAQAASLAIKTYVTSTAVENGDSVTIDSVSGTSSGVISSIMSTVVCIQAVSYQKTRGGITTSSSAGSGVVISEDGYIVTCQHVIDGATAVYILDSNNQEYEATVVGYTTNNDLAVLKIDAQDLSYMELDGTISSSVGDSIYVVGNPLGSFVLTITQGIISGVGRQVTINDTTMVLTQVDAAVNAGNSGGGLFNASGQLIGIVNAKSSGSDVEGIGFAIPIATVAAVVEQILNQAGVSL